MNATIAICTLVIGGSVLPSIDPPTDQPGIVIDPHLAWALESADTVPGESRSVATAPAPGSSPVGGGQAVRPAQPARPPQRQIPVAPTDPSWSGAATQWTPPTSVFSPARRPRASGRNSPPPPYLRSGSRRPAYQPRSAYSPRWTPARGTQPVAPAPTHRGTAARSKPFSDYRPQPAVSPYMNLFRRGDAFGTVDNYYTLVRPFVEQQYTNARVGGDIHRLQRASRVQSTAIDRLGRQAEAVEGIATPQFYQNFQGFYPEIDE